MREFVFRMALSFDEFKPYYQGYAENVQVTDINGLVLRIGARHFRPFLTGSGINGTFKLVIDEQGRLQSLHKL
ncbi:DUF2835 domain-containing protein [Shewanella sp. A3A]|uniref:DUF2835 domain-containing protein n=1 Tax=Shewanella electrica TaxID=515560 RepID=A0ABT2FKT1_9GAMM|nr:DUF2835 domain-containing protein [Shewanella electrica]MCH1919199.1 DUF2835 domain-containing protein [Shewanella ferrihydritica]MCH1923714.1 DUF2835 domain-containing protein [Shewanella electrica]MCS4556933.1 DUF2835 domain-containing protein [Shewanella electrica]